MKDANESLKTLATRSTLICFTTVCHIVEYRNDKDPSFLYDISQCYTFTEKTLFVAN